MVIIALGTVATWPVSAATMTILALRDRRYRALPRNLLMTSMTQMTAGRDARTG